MKTLVAYFSASSVTERVAKDLAVVTGADLYEIAPAVRYTKADLNWMNPNSRSSVEMKDKSSRPELANKDAKIENYDVIYVGFPIWWYIAPTIINTFLESYDFKNKTIVLFATSGGSGFGKTVQYLKDSVDASTKIIDGAILNRRPSQEKIKEWVDGLRI